MKINIPCLIILLMATMYSAPFCQEKMNVEGAIIIKHSEDPAPVPGTIRFNPNTNDFEGWNGFFWASLTGDITFETDVVTYYGTEYRTVKIGGQWWFVDNLATRHDRFINIPNIPIAYIEDPTAWASTTSPAYCYPDNDLNNDGTYGKLYNWYAVEGDSLCPTGWHIPTDAEWTALTNYLGGVDVAGGKMKETGFTHWITPNTGATNESGFTGLPAGIRHLNGTYSDFGYTGAWWSITPSTISEAWRRSLNYMDDNTLRLANDKNVGFSVRCVKD